MKLKFLNDVDYINYKKPSMFIGFPKCSFKCGRAICQNAALANEPDIEVNVDEIIDRIIP